MGDIMRNLALILFFLSGPVFADLTTTQLATLHADMTTNPDVQTMVSNEDDIGLAGYYSADTADVGWRTNFSVRELFDALDWQEVISRSGAERDTLIFMFELGQVDTGQANVRQGFADIFSGGQARSVNQRAALVTAAQRIINRIEKLFSSGLSGGAYTLSYEGPLSVRDAAFARVYQP